MYKRNQAGIQYKLLKSGYEYVNSNEEFNKNLYFCQMFQSKTMRNTFISLTVATAALLAACTPKTKVEPCVDSSTPVSASDSIALKNFIEQNNIEATYDSRGFYYRVHTMGSGKVPGQCAVIVTDYTGKLTNGNIFDSRNNITMNVRDLIAGFRMGVSLFKEGTEFSIYLPPSLGYGNNDNGSIPGGSILIFKIKLNSITQEIK